MKACKKCTATKALCDFPKSSQAKDGRYTYCKECCRNRAVAAMARPPDRTPPSGLKWCGKCRKDLVEAEFWPLQGTYDGLAKRCKRCSHKAYDQWRIKNKTKLNKHYRDDRKKDPQRYRDYVLKKRYRLPHGGYELLLIAQKAQCAICKRSEPEAQKQTKRRWFAVDHCHKTGAVRGLLCTTCNTGIGFLHHDPTVLQSAIEYLTK